MMLPALELASARLLDPSGITQVIGAVAAAVVAIIGALAARHRIENGKRPGADAERRPEPKDP